MSRGFDSGEQSGQMVRPKPGSLSWCPAPWNKSRDCERAVIGRAKRQVFHRDVQRSLLLKSNAAAATGNTKAP